MISLLNNILLVLALPALASALYLLLLTVIWRRSAPPEAGSSKGSMPVVVLVPAHNEALGIAATIRSLKDTDYPDHLRRVVVVADNCSDATAQVASAHGAEVIVRHDDQRRGKGWALRHAINTLLDEPESAWRALVVVDADTVVAPNLLTSVVSRLQEGAHAVQAAYLPSANGDSAMAVITDVAFTAFHLVRSGARERMHLSCGLRGNGMAFTRTVLDAVPHTAFSRTEDLEFGILLGLGNVRVAFAGDTRVHGDMPERADVVAQQRDRWIGGRLAMARRFAWWLVVAAVHRRSAMLADLAIDLIVPPLSALLFVTLLGLGTATAISLIAGTVLLSWFLWATALAALAIHVGHAARLSGRGRQCLRALTAIPGYALNKTRIALRGLCSTNDTWVRTTREGEVK